MSPPPPERPTLPPALAFAIGASLLTFGVVTNVTAFERPRGLLEPVGAGASIRPTPLGPINLNATCAELSAWVESVRDRIPKRLDELAVYPVSYRKVMYATLSPEVQRELWATHLRSFLEIGLLETDAQAAVVRGALENLEALFDPGAAGVNLRDELSSTADELMGHPLARQVFANLGPAEHGSLHALATNPGTCNCSHKSDWCGSKSACWGYDPPCDFVPGCGTLWLYTCTGICGALPED